MAEIKARIEADEVGDFMTIISQILDEFRPTPGQITKVVTVTIEEDTEDE